MNTNSLRTTQFGFNIERVHGHNLKHQLNQKLKGKLIRLEKLTKLQRCIRGSFALHH